MNFRVSLIGFVLDAALVLIRWLVISAFPLALAYAALCDIRTLIIPNWISAAIASLFLPAALLAGLEMQVIALHYGTGLFLFIIGAVFFAFGMLGGGDEAIFNGSPRLPSPGCCRR